METLHAGHVAVRTTVQLDGDVLTFATPAAADASVRKRHAERVEKKLRALARWLDAPASLVTWCAGGIYFLVMTLRSTPWALDIDAWTEFDWIGFLANATVSVAIGLGGRLGFVRRLLAKLSVWLITRQS